jgi:hypothetical protein
MLVIGNRIIRGKPIINPEGLALIIVVGQDLIFLSFDNNRS